MERVNLLTKQRVQLIDPSSSSLCLWISDSSNHSTTVDVGSGFHYKARVLPMWFFILSYLLISCIISLCAVFFALLSNGRRGGGGGSRPTFALSSGLCVSRDCH